MYEYIVFSSEIVFIEASTRHTSCGMVSCERQIEIVSLAESPCRWWNFHGQGSFLSLSLNS